ncbi:uncharacterized protein N7511_000220 [Penicillium nucicola]|uniref:uncharacterized protein n=1 Tax=Penicillium nucicola TaxID=1850975 RepID=UPI002544DBBC|nr:uncharacterized protein N7511_000220 [Penicillium nucicola]KAJ5775209.1 hypothetical protein N7511_000220 [Penicillium nucicola]
MNNRPSQTPVPFTQKTKEDFLQHVLENPSSRRISRHDPENLLEWLTNPSKRPTSQTEFSRRNYVRKTFTWDKNSQSLLAKPKNGEEGNRLVICEDRIADTVEWVHESSGHAGWDSTWKNISTSYYGILRSDVIFLLKQCQICAHDPSKRSKRTNANMKGPSSSHEAQSTSEGDDVEREDINWGSWTLETPATGQSVMADED